MIQGIRMMEVPPLERTHQESVNNYFCKKKLRRFIALLVSGISGWCSPVPKKAPYREWKSVRILNKALIPLLQWETEESWNPAGDTSSFTPQSCLSGCGANGVLIDVPQTASTTLPPVSSPVKPEEVRFVGYGTPWYPWKGWWNKQNHGWIKFPLEK